MSVARRKISILLLLVLNTNVVSGRMRGQWGGWGGYTSSTNVEEVDKEPSAEEDEDYECLPECAVSATHEQYKECVIKIAIGTGDRKRMVKMIEDAKKSDCCEDGPEGGAATTMTSSAEDEEKPDATATKTRSPPGKSEAVKKAMQRWRDRQKDKDNEDKDNNKPHNPMEALQQIKDTYAAGKAEEEEEEAMQMKNNDEEKPIEYSDVPVCTDGQVPLTSPSNCGRGGERCPDGSKCNIHPTDRWAVCCRDDIPELDDSLPDDPKTWDLAYMERAADCRDMAEKQQEQCIMLYDAMKNMDDTNPEREGVRKNLWDALGVLSKYGECEKKNKMKAILDVKAEEMLEEEKKKDDNNDGSSAEEEPEEPMQVYPIVPEKPKQPPMEVYPIVPEPEEEPPKHIVPIAPEPIAPEEPPISVEPEPLPERVCRPTIEKTNSNYDRFEGIGFNNNCTTDKDCFTAGCSSEVCSATRDVMTTCEVVEDFEGNCLCVSGTCQWAFCAMQMN